MRKFFGVLVLVLMPLALLWDLLTESFTVHAIFVLSLCLYPFCLFLGVGLLSGFDKIAKFIGLPHG